MTLKANAVADRTQLDRLSLVAGATLAHREHDGWDPDLLARGIVEAFTAATGRIGWDGPATGDLFAELAAAFDTAATTAYSSAASNNECRP